MLRYVDDPALVPPHGYRHAAVLDGEVVYTSGQTALDAAGVLQGEGDLLAQTIKAIENVVLALRSGGSGPDQVAQLEVFVVGLAEDTAAQVFRGMGLAARQLALPPVPTTILGVAALSVPGALVEVRAVGVVGPRSRQ